jgi:hypothetical protein
MSGCWNAPEPGSRRTYREVMGKLRAVERLEEPSKDAASIKFWPIRNRPHGIIRAVRRHSTKFTDFQRQE